MKVRPKDREKTYNMFIVNTQPDRCDTHFIKLNASSWYIKVWKGYYIEKGNASKLTLPKIPNLANIKIDYKLHNAKDNTLLSIDQYK